MKEVVDEDGTSRMHCMRTIHAEQNAICQAAKHGIPLKGSTLYCKMEPCRVCAMLIISVGITKVIAKKKYHAAQETRVLATAERPHHGLNAIGQRHGTHEAVVGDIDITQEGSFVSDETRLLPSQELGQVSPGVILNEFVLGLGELIFFELDVALGLFLLSLSLLVELANLVFVGAFGPAICEPTPIFSAVGASPHKPRILEINFENGLIRIHDDVTSLLAGLKTKPVKTTAHFHLAKVKFAIHQRHGVDRSDIAPFGFEEVQHARAVLDAARKLHLSNLVAAVGIGDAIHKVGILNPSARDLLTFGFRGRGRFGRRLLLDLRRQSGGRVNCSGGLSCRRIVCA